MAKVPVVIPDGPKIAALINERGWKIAPFAEALRPRRHPEALRSITLRNTRASVKFISQIARALSVDPEDIILEHLPLYPPLPGMAGDGEERPKARAA